jgi:hypothetical protein
MAKSTGEKVVYRNKTIAVPKKSDDILQPKHPTKDDPKRTPYRVHHQDTAGLKRRWLQAIGLFNKNFQSYLFANIKRFDDLGWKSAKSQAGIREAILDLSEDAAKKEVTEKQLLELVAHCFLLLCSKNPRMKEAVEAEGKLI